MCRWVVYPPHTLDTVHRFPTLSLAHASPRLQPTLLLAGIVLFSILFTRVADALQSARAGDGARGGSLAAPGEHGVGEQRRRARHAGLALAAIDQASHVDESRRVAKHGSPPGPFSDFVLTL